MLDACKSAMNKRSWIVARCIVLIGALSMPTGAQQVLENASCGRIVNAGRIEVRGSLESHSGGTIANGSGVVTISGNARIEQSALDGRTEFLGDTAGAEQRVPQITYQVLYFRGQSRKMLDTASQRSLVSTDTLIVESPSELIISSSYPLIARGRVHHDGMVNRDGRYGAIILQGSAEQRVSGRGSMSALELDNLVGASLEDSAQISIRHTLYLHRGQLRNSPQANIAMLPGSLVIRTDSASVVDFLIARGGYSVRYDGTEQILTGNELPANDSLLRSLVVRNRRHRSRSACDGQRFALPGAARCSDVHRSRAGLAPAICRDLHTLAARSELRAPTLGNHRLPQANWAPRR